jgi:hypothetical protein
MYISSGLARGSRRVGKGRVVGAKRRRAASRRQCVPRRRARDDREQGRAERSPGWARDALAVGREGRAGGPVRGRVPVVRPWLRSAARPLHATGSGGRAGHPGHRHGLQHQQGERAAGRRGGQGGRQADGQGHREGARRRGEEAPRARERRCVSRSILPF